MLMACGEAQRRRCLELTFGVRTDGTHDQASSEWLTSGKGDHLPHKIVWTQRRTDSSLIRQETGRIAEGM